MRFSLSAPAEGTASVSTCPCWNVTSPAHVSYTAKCQPAAAGRERGGSWKMLESVICFRSSLLRDTAHLRANNHSIPSFCHAPSSTPSPSPCPQPTPQPRTLLPGQPFQSVSWPLLAAGHLGSTTAPHYWILLSIGCFCPRQLGPSSSPLHSGTFQTQTLPRQVTARASDAGASEEIHPIGQTQFPNQEEPEGKPRQQAGWERGAWGSNGRASDQLGQGVGEEGVDRRERASGPPQEPWAWRAVAQDPCGIMSEWGVSCAVGWWPAATFPVIRVSLLCFYRFN